jgi:catalase
MKQDHKAELGQAGIAGEIHQSAGVDVPALTTQQGVPVYDDQNSLRVGERGPTALEDLHFREKIFLSIMSGSRNA